jgi:predicted transcriptional regulator of viral defense system
VAKSDGIADGIRHTPARSALIAEIAERQHGVVSLRQLRALGLSASAVRTRVAAGSLHRMHSGVYAVGHRRVTRRGRYMAAVLACGRGAALSHRSAADLRGVRRSSRPRIDVTAPTRTGRGRVGLDVHAGRTLQPQDVAIVDGIPCTSVARTLLDLAEVVDGQALAGAVNQAEILRVLDVRQVEEVLGRARGRRGATALRQALAAHDPSAERTRSELERRFLAICRAAGLPRPIVNAPIALDGEQVEVDFAWPRHRLVVETDGWQTHGTRRAFERDRDRDRRLLRARWRVARFGARQVVTAADDVAEELSALLHSTAAAT